ncbi:acetyl/propionyl/methylcrotonyl-CoA carboxylase subunit alpha [Pseudonocardia endophytica]|uniref:Biotin-dependent 3-methylcrotonyl-coenzyme A carboxylase alpha1 subunit n=1 Tax=Pseudonocardia endophytica TaxID=401976 RepID=A0A4R1HEB9_PSEEN|nr:acetyl-CoA carboxylase biotin carboxylase subunit [Pseudonocardia endophytica]TCK19938.1 acetyl-CoA/propionyl-CoA carboxylase biotin carboxyl carrier protein [Pseudonocardia endophytica]
MFDTVLVANRGEIAVRVIRTLRALGIRSVAVYSDADADAPHVLAADEAVRIGPAAAAESYLSIENVIAAARATGAEAIHPGYGFLSENTAFAAACEQAGIAFVGPPSSAIDAMGDKIRAKQTVSKAGVPVVPGSDGAGLSDDDLADAVAEIGYPVLLKPSAGGGGKGMREVYAESELPDAIAGARREARGSFGDDTLLVERLVTTPRHIEIQVMADGHGTVVHLGERECSLQRRHQKIVEEAPSALLTASQRSAMGESACEAARSVGYTGAGTVEFIVSSDRPDEFFFMEMNTRLQVEHPVTEMVTGLDLVELQLRVAAGERLPITQDDVELRGHAVEARVYAETVSDGMFLPSGGRVLALHEPVGPGVRVDSGLADGTLVGSDYDPMLSKVIAWGADRDEALRRLDTALGATTVLGLDTNVGFLRGLLADADVRAGNLDTGLVGRRLADLATTELPPDVLTAVVGQALLRLEPDSAVVDPFDVPGGWRVGEAAWTTRRLVVAGHEPVEVRARGRARDAEIVVGDADPVRTSTSAVAGGLAHVRDGRSRRYAVATGADGVVWIARDGSAWGVREQEPLEAARTATDGGGGPVVSPMPGTVTVVEVAEGDQVTAGTTLVVVEAMKMEHVLTAPVDGTVRELRARTGGTVARGDVLVVVEPATESSERGTSTSSAEGSS